MKPLSTRDTQRLAEKLQSLSHRGLYTVEDFVDFLRSRAEDPRRTSGAARASEPALAAVWNNPDDAEYDRL
jgi:hypothetical protein